jgi:hypothetical protein
MTRSADHEVPELEPFDDAAFAAAFERLRSPTPPADPPRRDATTPPIRFVGRLIKRLPPPRSPSPDQS